MAATSTDPMVPPAPQVGALLRIAWERLQRDLYAALHDAGFDDLRPVHHPLLRWPPLDGTRPSELASRLRLSRQATNDLLREMEALGYLRLDQDPDDGRARLIRYTDRGWAFFKTGSAISARVGERWAEQIGEGLYDQMVAALSAIVALPDDDAERPRPLRRRAR